MERSIVIDKSLVVSHRQCPRRAWLEYHGTAAPADRPLAVLLKDEGRKVHEAARQLRPGATRIASSLRLADAAAETAAAMRAGNGVLLEASFVAGNLGVRADIVEVGEDGLHITDVKSGAGIQANYLDDAAVQFACVTDAGYRVASVRIEHPDTKRVLQAGEPLGSVLSRELVTDAVASRALLARRWVADCASTLANGEPDTLPGDQCDRPHPCPFVGHCGRTAVDVAVDSVSVLPSKAGPIRDCMEGGMTRVGDMPPGAFTNARNAMVREAILAETGVVRPELAHQLVTLPYPRAFVDFEAASPALPLHPGMAPYEQLPFQWSCHRVREAGAPAEHSAFLSLSGADPRREFVETLLAAVAGAACVIVYSGFESQRLREMAVAYPDLAADIDAVRSRLVDLLPLARRGYYHPEQRGSWSLKAILPTVPGSLESRLRYDAAVGIGDGMEAQAAYLRAIDPTNIGSKDGIRADLLAYCAIDTGGLLHFVRFVESFAAERQGASGAD